MTASEKGLLSFTKSHCSEGPPRPRGSPSPPRSFHRGPQLQLRTTGFPKFLLRRTTALQRDDKGPPSFQLLNVSSVGFCRFGRHMGRPRLDNIGKKAGQCLRICHRVTPSVITPRTILSIYHICKTSALQPAVHNTCATDNGREFLCQCKSTVLSVDF